MTTFVDMYHPLIPSTEITPARVPVQAIDENAAKGWLLVDPDGVLPSPSTPYYTKEALLSQIQGGAAPIGTALRAAFGLSIAATMTASGALAVGKHTPVDATGGARTMTLPTGAADGVTIGVEKVDASTNAVTVTGNLRGVAGQSITLAWTHETLVLRADASGSWWPVSGHKTKSSLDAAFARSQDGVLTAPRPRPPINSSLITGMQPGHGYTIFNSTAATLTDDTTDFLLGSQSLKITTKTDNTAASVQKTGLSIDTTGKSLRVPVKVADMTNLTELLLYAANDTGLTNYYQWTLIDPDPVQSGPTAQQWMKSGEWVWLTLPFNDVAKVGTPTRTGITVLRMRTRATNGNSVTINWNGVALVDEPTAYPNGVVSFTYDDSLLTTYTEARKALDVYGWVGTAYTICDLVGTGAPYMSLTQLKALHRAGWEVGAHSNTLADHQTGFHNMTADQLHANFRNMRRWLVDNGFTGGDHMAYPQGAYTPAVIDVARQYFASARTINRRIGESLRPGSALRLRSTSVTNTDALATITAKIDTAKANKSWLILTFHDLVASPANGNQSSIANHQAVVDYCNTVGVAVQPVGDVLRTAA